VSVTSRVTEHPCAMIPMSSSPSALHSGAGAYAARGSSASPTSVWMTILSQKSFCESAANATSNFAVIPGASLTLLNASATRKNFFVVGLIIFTVWMRLSALRTVTSLV